MLFFEVNLFGNLIDLQSQLGLLAGSGVLLENALGRGLIDGFHSGAEGGLELLLIAFGDGGIDLLDGGLHIGFDAFIAEGLDLSGLDSLLGGFDIRQLSIPLFFILRLLYSQKSCAVKGIRLRGGHGVKFHKDPLQIAFPTILCG